MKTPPYIEANLDRFEGEGGALDGQPLIAWRNNTPGAIGRSTAAFLPPASWRVRPAFLAELQEILNVKELSERESRKRSNILSDRDEEFTQRFQELIDTQVLPQFDSVAALLSGRFFPVEVRVSGPPEQRVCSFAFSSARQTENWALRHGEIDGPSIMFQADTAAHNVVYTANFRSGIPEMVQRVMEISEITDSFIEQELRQLISSLSVEEQGAPQRRSV